MGDEDEEKVVDPTKPVMYNNPAMVAQMQTQAAGAQTAKGAAPRRPGGWPATVGPKPQVGAVAAASPSSFVVRASAASDPASRAAGDSRADEADGIVPVRQNPMYVAAAAAVEAGAAGAGATSSRASAPTAAADAMRKRQAEALARVEALNSLLARGGSALNLPGSRAGGEDSSDSSDDEVVARPMPRMAVVASRAAPAAAVVAAYATAPSAAP